MNPSDRDLTDASNDDRCNSVERRISVTDGDLERELDYEPVPAQSVRRVRAKFRYIGRGQPMPFRIEDEN